MTYHEPDPELRHRTPGPQGGTAAFHLNPARRPVIERGSAAMAGLLDAERDESPAPAARSRALGESEARPGTVCLPRCPAGKRTLDTFVRQEPAWISLS
jgi:hypothetical protein